MELEVLRFSSQNDSTLGILFDVSNGREFLCFTLEDEYRTVKEYGKTRIPAGEYRILLKRAGGFHERYKKRFSRFHKGMLWIGHVPGFEHILIHIGNNDDNTAGCLLIGDTSQQNLTENGFIGASTSAYRRIYPLIANAVDYGEEVTIKYVDFDSVQ